MKLHEVERIGSLARPGCNAETALTRRAVPGGWMYVEVHAEGSPLGSATNKMEYCSNVFVPDPTAEHVTHGAGGAEAEAIYRDAVRDCWAIADDAMRYQGAPEHDRATMRKAFDALRFDGSTLQTGEG